MFPEGTDRTAYTLKRSKEYARKRGLPELRNVLYPRTAGFVHMIKKMKARQYLKYVYDVTVAYPKDIVQNETDMVLKGRVSRNYHNDFKQTFVIVFGFFFWVSVVSVWVYHLFFLRIVQVGFAFLMLNYAYIYGVHGGIDNFIYHRWETWRQRRAMRDCVTV
ncbi:ACL-10 protein [Aphelenchoides avenae]|nr:ACL-10 protein [Aphelenchus avenae]